MTPSERLRAAARVGMLGHNLGVVGALYQSYILGGAAGLWHGRCEAGRADEFTRGFEPWRPNVNGHVAP